MKMKAFLMFVLLFLCSMGTKAQDLGANYNENIDYPKENAIRTHIPTLKFIQAKKALGDRVKFILSLKIPFEL